MAVVARRRRAFFFRLDLFLVRLLMVWSVALCAGCSGSLVSTPLDKPLFPTGLAMHPDGDHLLVVSSNQDLAVENGALLVADLTRVRAALADDEGAAIADAYEFGVEIPSFADQPVLTSDGARILLPLRAQSSLASIDWTPDTAKLSCKPAPACGQKPRALQLSVADPFSLVITQEDITGDGVGMTQSALGLLASRRVLLVQEDPTQSKEQISVVGDVDLGEDIGGVRALALRPASGAVPPLLFATADLDKNLDLLGAVLAWFEPKDGASVQRLSLSELTSSILARNLLFLPRDTLWAGAPDVLFVTLREPDAIASFDIEDDGENVRVQLAGLAPTCREPTSLAFVPLSSSSRLIIACQTDDTVQALDPLSLLPTDTLRFVGRNPYAVAVNTAQSPAEIFVTFFLDNSVGVFGFDSTSSGETLALRGRIGTPLPKPEDGRQ